LALSFVPRHRALVVAGAHLGIKMISSEGIRQGVTPVCVKHPSVSLLLCLYIRETALLLQITPSVPFYLSPANLFFN
jgi:hypothetical protein